MEPLPSFIEKFQRENYGFSDKPAEGSVPDNMGYLKITDFLDPTSDAVGITAKEKAHELLQNMRGKKALIIDLRGSHGGSPEMVEHILSYLLTEQDKTKIPDGVYNTLHDASTGSDKAHRVRDTDFCLNMPIRILIDEKTFSAAEEMAYDLQQINANSLRDGRIQVVGQNTTGGAHPMTGFPLVTLGANPTQEISQRVNPDYFMWVPDRTAINPYTHTNWEDGPKLRGEKPGVKPDVEIPVKQDALVTTVSELATALNASRDVASRQALMTTGGGFISQSTATADVFVEQPKPGFVLGK